MHDSTEAPKFNLNRDEARAAWYAALRSGQYQQARNVLCALAPNTTELAEVDSVTGYCCLGVAMDLFCQLEPQHGVTYRPLPNSRVYEHQHQLSNTNLLPIVKIWLGMTNEGGAFAADNRERLAHYPVKNSHVYPATECNTLTGLNDGAQLTFTEIAEFCEWCPRGLYVETVGASN